MIRGSTPPSAQTHFLHSPQALLSTAFLKSLIFVSEYATQETGLAIAFPSIQTALFPRHTKLFIFSLTHLFFIHPPTQIFRVSLTYMCAR